MSQLEKEADECTRGGEDAPLIQVLQKWIAALDGSFQQSQQQPQRAKENEFHEDFFLSRVVEILVRNVMLYYPTNGFKDARCLDMVLSLLQRVLLGEVAVHKTLWNYIPRIKNEIALIGGEAERTSEREIVQLVVAMFSLFKITPLDKALLEDLQTRTATSGEFIFELQKKEATEGIHSVQLNQEKVEITSRMLQEGMEILEIINTLLSVDVEGSRKCLCIDPTTWYALFLLSLLSKNPPSPPNKNL